MALPLIPILATALGGTVLGGSVLGKKEYTTITQAPFNTYSPTMTYSPMTSIAYTSGSKIINSPFASSSEKIGLTASNEPYTNSMPNANLGTGINNYIPFILVVGGVLVVFNMTKKK
jgi:hypothetical protein